MNENQIITRMFKEINIDCDDKSIIFKENQTFIMTENTIAVNNLALRSFEGLTDWKAASSPQDIGYIYDNTP